MFMNLSLDVVHQFGILNCGLVAKHHVHILQASSFSFGHKEQNPEEHHHGESSKEHIGSKSYGCNHGGSNQSNDEVAHPVGGCGDRHCLCTYAQREDLTRIYPSCSKRISSYKMLEDDEIRKGIHIYR